MRAKFTKQALINYASMVEKYGDIYLNEYGQVSLSQESHEMKYQDEKRKVPARSCMYVRINRTNFPKTVEELDEMFLRQTLNRQSEDRKSKEFVNIGRNPEVVVGDESAFERMTSQKEEKEEVSVEEETESPKNKGGRPRKVNNDPE